MKKTLESLLESLERFNKSRPNNSNLPVNNSLKVSYNNGRIKNGNSAIRTQHVKNDFSSERDNDCMQRGTREDNWRKQGKNSDSTLRNIRTMAITKQNDEEDGIMEEMDEIWILNFDYARNY